MSEALPGQYELRDVVEPALARALVLAAEAQRWDVVAQIADELKARREMRDMRSGRSSLKIAFDEAGRRAIQP